TAACSIKSIREPGKKFHLALSVGKPPWPTSPQRHEHDALPNMEPFSGPKLVPKTLPDTSSARRRAVRRGAIHQSILSAAGRVEFHLARSRSDERGHPRRSGGRSLRECLDLCRSSLRRGLH